MRDLIDLCTPDMREPTALRPRRQFDVVDGELVDARTEKSWQEIERTARECAKAAAAKRAARRKATRMRNVKERNEAIACKRARRGRSM